ncbi:hypothetical protein [Actinacidiphila glaucinigra]|uniref:Uncharacterized protein n=1 Tax=Actinacidiphila glaucinigra TaxID=235986 RepID=A0A239EZB3_9ACTN|nr:hypothetical protein [Actinacidiphila glaucinigra]SNS49969.1 hypothetical protein SAMN05216252_106231 [Actinacidiphila glaucinigra]
MTAPFLAPFMKANPRNLASLEAAWARMTELGYSPRETPVDEPDGCTRTRCAGAHHGYPGSEHRWALVDELCGVEFESYYSHMRDRKGAKPAPPRRHKGCPYSGAANAAKRAARYAEIGRPVPEWDTEAQAATQAA